MTKLPEWERGTPAFLIVAGPHAMPISTAVRAGDRRVLLSLGRGRETLARLREDPGVALAMLGEGFAFTAYGTASVLREELDEAPVAAVAIDVESVQDHLADGRTEIVDGARWRWCDPAVDGEAEDRIVTALMRLAEA